jgi:hypothetical protein
MRYWKYRKALKESPLIHEARHARAFFVSGARMRPSPSPFDFSEMEDCEHPAPLSFDCDRLDEPPDPSRYDEPMTEDDF